MLRRALALAASLTLVALVGGGVYAWSGDIRLYYVDSGSMSPTISAGALVVDRPVTPATVFHIGDIVTFHPTPGYTVTHRIAGIGADGISTRGDANPSRDVGTIQPDLIVGRMAFSIPYVGYAVVFFQHPIWIAGLLLLLLAPLVVWQLTETRTPSKEARTTIGEGPR